jgi:TPR repeat protein
MTAWKPNKRQLLIGLALAGALTAATARLLGSSTTTQPAHAEHAGVAHEQNAIGEAIALAPISVEAAAKLKEAFAAQRGFAADVPQEITASSGVSEPDQTGTISSAPTPSALVHDHSLATSVSQMSQAEVDRMVAKGEQVLKTRDIATARLYFRRAADAGDARGALGMARSFDSKVLQELRMFSVRADASEAARWYARARELGYSPPLNNDPLGAPQIEARTSS